MSKKILSVGQCPIDGPALRHLLEERFDAAVTNVKDAAAASKALEGGSFDLVLVNREFNADKASGVSWIRSFKADHAQTPAMLVSDRADAQAEAVEAGALEGFGKSEMKAKGALAPVRDALGA